MFMIFWFCPFTYSFLQRKDKILNFFIVDFSSHFSHLVFIAKNTSSRLSGDETQNESATQNEYKKACEKSRLSGVESVNSQCKF